MRSSLTISIVIHLLLTLVLLVSMRLTGASEARPVIVRVRLVEPRGEAPPAPPAPAAALTAEPAPAPPPVPLPQEAPPVRVRHRDAEHVAVRPPAAAAPQPLAVEEPRRARPRPAETPPPAAPPAPVAELPPGKSTQVETDAPAFTEFAYYRVAMRNKISSLWSPPRASSPLSCTVRFRIVRSGVIVGAGVAHSSGLAFFDHTALRAVVEASPLPPLPADFPADVVGVTFQFAYNP